MAEFNWDDFWTHGGSGWDPFNQQGLSYNAQQSAERAAQTYEPWMGDFGEHLNRSMPSLQGQMGQALGMDWQQMQAANEYSQGQQQEGLQTLQDALGQYDTNFSDFMSQIEDRMAGIESGSREAMGKYESGTQEAIDWLFGEAGTLLESGQRTGDELRGYGQEMLGESQELLDMFTDRARKTESRMEKHIRQARGTFGGFADAMLGAMQDSLATVEQASADFMDNSLAMAQGQIHGINTNLDSQKQMIQMNPDMNEAQKQAAVAGIDRQGAEQIHVTAAKTAFGINAQKYQNTMNIAAAEQGVAQVNGTLAQVSAGLETSLGSLLTQTMGITSDLLKSGGALAFGMKEKAFGMMAQGAMQEFSAQVQSSGIMKHAADMKFMQEDKLADWDQYIAGMSAENQKFLGSMWATQQANLLEGNTVLADYQANMTVNPTSIASVLMSLFQFQMMGLEAGIDFSTTNGLDFGAMMAGENPSQYFNVNFPGSGSGEIPSNWEAGFSDEQMQNLSELGMLGLG